MRCLASHQQYFKSSLSLQRILWYAAICNLLIMPLFIISLSLALSLSLSLARSLAHFPSHPTPPHTSRLFFCTCVLAYFFSYSPPYDPLTFSSSPILETCLHSMPLRPFSHSCLCHLFPFSHIFQFVGWSCQIRDRQMGGHPR